jgi:uncharacterized protein YfaQ (DUF2300 family)
MDRAARGIATVLACLAAPLSVATAAEAQVAWLRDGKVEWRPLAGKATALPPQVPLGSLWKLFVHAYLTDTGSHEPPYRCSAQPRQGVDEEEYCCPPGGSVERDTALAKSCGLYFAPTRLAISTADWQRHWQVDNPQAAWLRDLSQLAPQTQLTPAQILAALDTVSPAARQAARSALFAVLTEGYGRSAWPIMGSGPRFKTYSWHDDTGAKIGGGAGWLADGTPFWFVGAGASRNVIDRYAEPLAAALPPPGAIDDEAATCVDVRFFARYPIRHLHRSATGDNSATIEFANGKHLRLSSTHGLQIADEDGQPVVRGRFALEEYVARVVDREGDASQTEAARALAVAARSYVHQQGRPLAGCLAIADDSRSQRVAANPPTTAAQSVARFTEGLTLNVPVRYHRNRAGSNVMSWQRAVALARGGARFDAILADAYGNAAVGGPADQDCRRLGAAEQWLGRRAETWRRQLAGRSGFEMPAAVTVCTLSSGNPYSDQGKNRIYVRDWMSAQGRLALTHEYLHLAFRFHPDGGNERFIEQTARALDSGVPQ